MSELRPGFRTISLLTLCCHFPSHIFKSLYRCLVDNTGMPALSVVEDLDVFEDCSLGLSAGSEPLTVHQGFVAQIGLRPISPLPRTDLAYGHGTGYAKSCETVEDSGADLDLCDLTIEVARREALAKSFYTMHLRFDTAPAVIPGQISPQSAT